MGIDFSLRMIEFSRRFILEDDTTRFAVADARDLSAFAGERFGLVLFSYNGIDVAGHDDRLRILAQVRGVVAEDGYFAFQSHSLDALPFEVRRPRVRPHRPRATYRDVRTAARLAFLNRRLDLDAARKRGWLITRDQGNNFSLVHYYVRAQTQVAQLAEAGFENCEVWDDSGRPVDPEAPGKSRFLFYFCTPRADRIARVHP